MNVTRLIATSVVITSVVALAPRASAQGTVADYKRAMGLRDKYQGLVLNNADQSRWIEKTSKYVYRRTVQGGYEFMVVDAEAKTKAPAFDHQKLASTLSSMLGRTVSPVDLPFSMFEFTEDNSAIRFLINPPGAPPGGGGGGRGGGIGDAPAWRCTLDTYTCRRPEGTGRGGRGGGRGGLGGPVRAPFEINGADPRKSPDGKMEAVVQNYNVAIRAVDSRTWTLLSTDGSDGGYYDPDSISWSPDSKKIAVYKVKPGFRRFVTYVESSPEDQLQPKNSTMQYAKPGDVLDVESPVLFNVDTKGRVAVDNALFPNAYDVTRLEWRKDSSAVTFEYNQRGHQVYRVIEIDAASGKTRAVISEEPKTFFCYSGKRYRSDVGDGKEIIWMSERDGWNHLYMYDGVSGKVKHQITKGEWVVRGVQRVDEEAKQIIFSASGTNLSKDPYFVHYYRINFDGTGLTPLTSVDANHNVAFSTDFKYYVDQYSRIDMAPVAELRRTADAGLVMELEKADNSALVKAGWKPPEVFVAKGRDGTTDIWGVIFRPTNFDPAKKYPVIENIYAGPQGSFVPKTFNAFSAMQAQAEIGFIVVQIDGMGTNNRSKAFHDVAWKNLKDAGLEDRILWHKAAAAKFPWYDVSQGVGVFGTSAGGQNTMSALLFHPEFYKVGVSNSGSHDNRMDKIWWNELWMGWPIGPEYAASSNVDNAHLLQGKLLLVMGEMDKNVDPSSTMQVVNALIKANKKFEFLDVPGGGHGAGGLYGQRLLMDFFVHNMMHAEPPDWNASAPLPALLRPPTPPGM